MKFAIAFPIVGHGGEHQYTVGRARVQSVLEFKSGRHTPEEEGEDRQEELK